MSVTTPDSFVETKYYLKFSNIEEYTDVSGTIDNYAVTKAGIVPKTRRNKDFTLQIMTFSFVLFSVKEVLRGQKIKVTRTESGVEKDIFFGFVDSVDYDEGKNEYTVKVAHEFKYLQRVNIRKSELESVLIESNCSKVLKKLVELEIDRDIDFSQAELYNPVAAAPGTSLLSATFYMKMLWCVGLDYASSTPNEDGTATYWDVFSKTIGLLGCVVYFDGTKYIVKHYTQDSNYDIDNLDFVDKNNSKYISTKEMYYSCGFTANYNSDLGTYDTTAEDELSDSSEYSAIIKNRDISTGTSNLKVFLTLAASDRPDILNVGRNDAELNGQKLYLDDYWNQAFTTDYEDTNNLPLSKSYNPVSDSMSVVQHIPYDFQLTNYYYYEELTGKETLTGTSELKQTDSVYVEFNKNLDDNALSNIELRKNGIKQDAIITFEKSTSEGDSKVIRINFFNRVAGTYTIYISKEFKSATLRKIPLVYLAVQQGFIITEDTPPE